MFSSSPEKKLRKELLRAVEWTAAEYKFIKSLQDELEEIKQEKDTGKEVQEISRAVSLLDHIGRAERRAAKFEQRAERKLRDYSEHLDIYFTAQQELNGEIQKVLQQTTIEHDALINYASRYEGLLRQELTKAEAEIQLQADIEAENPQKAALIHVAVLQLVERVQQQVQDAEKWVAALEASLKKAQEIFQRGKNLSMTGEGMKLLRKYGFPIEVYPDLASFLAQHPKDLKKMARAAGDNILGLFQYGLPALKDLINEKYWPGIVQMACARAWHSGPFFAFYLPAVKDLINERTWPGMVQMVEAGNDTESLFQYLSSLSDLINELTWPILVDMVVRQRIRPDLLRILLTIASNVTGTRQKRLIALLQARAEQSGFNLEYLLKEVSFSNASEIEFTLLLLKYSFFPTKLLIELLKKSENPKGTIKEWLAYSKTDFNKNDSLRVELEYSKFRKLLDYSLKPGEKYTYIDYINLVSHLNEEYRESSTITITEMLQAELYYTAYEIALVYSFLKKLLTFKQPIIVVENMRYGQIIGRPLEKKLPTMTFITARIGSSECHDSFFHLKRELFDRAFIKMLLRTKPIMVVLDGTAHIVGRFATHRFPDSFIGYTNYFTAFNIALGYDDPILVERDQNYIELAKKSFADTITMFRERMNFLRADKRPYQIYYQHLSNGNLEIRSYRMGYKTPKQANLERIQIIKAVPLFLVNGTIATKDIPASLRNPNFPEHYSAFFDDKDKFISTLLTFSKKGIQLNRENFFALLQDEVDKMIQKLNL